MTIPWDDLKTQYNTLADELIDTINAAALTLYYNAPNLTAISTSPVPSGVFDAMNSQNFIESLHNRVNEGGTGYQQTTLSETITVRSYWNKGNSNFPIDLRANFDVVKINAYATDTQKLLNANYAIVNGYKVKLIPNYSPLPYGFGKRYTISYWEKIN